MVTGKRYSQMKIKVYSRACAILLLISPITNAAVESDMDLARAALNPLAVNKEARYYTLPFVDYSNTNYNNTHSTQNILELKPVIPRPFTESYDLIFRTIIPIKHQPSTSGFTNGLGDINPTIFLAPAKNDWFIWGVGPTFVLPTASNQALGAGKWSIGPELALIAMPKQFMFAILTYNIWSIGGQSNRPNVNELSFQYFINYNFPHGWYITSQPVNKANWTATPSQRWTVPVGGGGGRAFRINGQAIHMGIQAYYNAIRPAKSGLWTVQFSVEFLFPDNRTA